jgi:PAS domain S-box-containing protein
MIPRSVLESVVEHSPAAIWLVDASHRVVWANDSTTKLAGGSTKGALVLDDPRHPFALVRERYLDSQTHLERREWCSPITNGHLTSGWVAPWMEEGQRLGTICLLRNVPTAGESQLADVLHTVLDQIPDPVVVKDAQGDFLLANQACATLYGTTPAQMVGRHDDDFGVPKHVADGFRESVLRVMATGLTEVILEQSRDAKTGEMRHYRSIKKPFKSPRGENQILVLAQDVTDVVRGQQRVIESEQRLQDVLRITHEGVWDWHVPSGRVDHNQQWYTLLGVEEGREPDTVETFAAHVHPDDRADVFRRLDELVQGRVEVYRSNHRLISSTGVMHVKDRGQVVERDAHGKPLRVVGSFADITAEWRATEAVNQARVSAEQANLAKSRFLATMSHELRTPLNGILGMAQVLLRSSSDPEALDAARTILESGETLLTELNDILDLSKIEAGKLVLEPRAFTPGALLTAVERLFRTHATERGLTLEVVNHTRDRVLRGDVTRLRQMVSNLVSNALKFTPRGTITVRIDERSAGERTVELEVSVTDTGIGIAKEQIPQLFQPFTQADSSTTRRFGGTGLGLSIVRRLVELMGGIVGVDSAMHEGSRFWFRVTLPVEEGAVTSPASSTPLPQLTGVRVLAVEDNAINQKVIMALLSKLGVDAAAVGNGARAVELLTQPSRPDLVLMDCQMPEMDGLEATKLIRGWEKTRGVAPIPIIAVTASAYEEDRQRCLSAGMNDLITKPVALETLAESMQRWLSDAQLSG